MSIDENKKTYLEFASNIQDYEKISNTELANGYIENENNSLVNNYFAALIIKNWVTIYKLKSSVSFCRTINYEDVYEWLVQSILIVLKCRKWLDTNSSLYQDPEAFDKMLTITVSHVRIANLNYLSRKDRIKDSYNCSLDEMKENIDFDFPYTDLDTSSTDHIVQYYIDHNKVFNVLLLFL